MGTVAIAATLLSLIFFIALAMRISGRNPVDPLNENLLVQPTYGIPKIRGNGKFLTEVGSEEFYREALDSIFGKGKENSSEMQAVVAVLKFEGDDQKDKNKVAVYIADRKVGHLSLKMAMDFRLAIQCNGLMKWKAFLVDALVHVPTDEGDCYGVMLDIYANP